MPLPSSYITNILTLSPTAYFSLAATGGGGGLESPYQKRTSECLSLILFYTFNYTYMESPDPKFQVSSCLVLILAAAQSSAVNSTNVSKIGKLKIYKGIFGGRLFPRAAKK
jgi:hypothetical protein